MSATSCISPPANTSVAPSPALAADAVVRTVLTCGGRSYATWVEGKPDWAVQKERDAVWAAMDWLDSQRGPITRLVEGAARGADTATKQWAMGRTRMDIRSYRADWKTHGRPAGPLRNTKMLDDNEVDLVVAFPGGRGTADMVRQALLRGVPVWRPTVFLWSSK